MADIHSLSFELKLINERMDIIKGQALSMMRTLVQMSPFTIEPFLKGCQDLVEEAGHLTVRQNDIYNQIRKLNEC